MPKRGEIIGIALVGIIFFAIITSSLWGGAGTNLSADQQNKTPVPTPVKTPTSLFPASIPAPSIKVNSPQNITYNTSMPPIDFVVAGSNLDTVLLSVDGGLNITIPHDGSMAKIDFAKGNPLFIDDFSGITKGRWKESGNWRVEGGRYVTTGWSSAFGEAGWDDYIIEARTKIASGKDISIDLRWDGQSKHYRVQTTTAYNNLILRKVDDKGYTNLFVRELSGFDPTKWHTWKILAEGGKIKAFIDDIPYIEYTDSDKPYLKGNARLSVANTNVEYDHIYVYKPFSDSDHNLTIFASNTAGNASSQIIYFITNTTEAEAIIGRIGVPMVRGGLEITVKSATPTYQFTNVWLNVKNIENTEKPLKLGPGNIIIDNKGQQYENIKVPRGAEISQTDLYPQAMREGAVFFERLSDGSRSLKKLVLYVNGEKIEFLLN